MNGKFSDFFKGKVAYILVSGVVCIAAVGGAVAVVRHNSAKADTLLESLKNASTTGKVMTEDADAPTNDTESSTSILPTSASEVTDKTQIIGNDDKTLKYLGEYDKLTAAYEKNRKALENKKASVPYNLVTEPFREEPPLPKPTPGMSYEEFTSVRAQYMSEVYTWQAESKAHEAAVSAAVSRAENEQANRKAEIQKEIDALYEQYQKDVSALKAKYGI